MANPKKLPKWAIKQAGGINKKAWALARRGRGAKRSVVKRKAKRAVVTRRATARRVEVRATAKPGWGSAFKIGRTVDVFSGPVQGAVGKHGVTMEAGKETLRRYSANMSEGPFDVGTAKGTYGGVATGMARNWLRSKMGIYRGVGQKKALSIVMAANPEILATGEVPAVIQGQDVPRWNGVRQMYDRAYEPINNDWDANPNSPGGTGQRFWQSIGLDFGLKIGQKAAERWINPLLPAGYNL